MTRLKSKAEIDDDIAYLDWLDSCDRLNQPDRPDPNADEVMRLLQLLIPTEEQVEAGLLVEKSPNEYSVVHPDSYQEDLMELAMDKALKLRGMKKRKKQSPQRGRRYD